MKEIMLYVGTYIEESQQSIYRFNLSPNGELVLIDRLNGGPNPSYMACDESNRFLFVTNEIENGDGMVRSFRIDDDKKSVELKTVLDSKGKLPVSVTYIKAEGSLFVSNYNSGNVALFSVNADGSLVFETDAVPSKKKLMNTEGSVQSHAHQVVRSPNGKFIFIVDKGLDRIRSHPFANGNLQVEEESIAFQAKPGWGPRQLAFHPSREHAYLVHELESKVSTLAYDSKTGKFRELQISSCIPESFSDENKSGGISVSANGNYLYISNRGHNSIAVFEIDQESFLLALCEYKDVEGEWPREFAIDPENRFLVVGNQKSNSLTSFAIDPDTGRLTFTGFQAVVEQPAFIRFF